jgi:hypothetical protein
MIADEIVLVMQADMEACFKACSEYVLSSIIVNYKAEGSEFKGSNPQANLSLR